jgi:hypothetical protein
MINYKIRKAAKNVIYFLHGKLFSFRYKNVLDLLVPNLFKIDKIKLGREGDGTYILPKGLFSDVDVLLSFGVADDISFEKDFMNLYPDCRVFAFDPSISELPEKNDQINFQCKGLAGKISKTKNLVNFETILEDAKIDKRKTVFIKMDIEGWEWGVYDRLDLDRFDFPVIVMEFHMMSINRKTEYFTFFRDFFKRYQILKKILKSYYIYHLHANNVVYTEFKNFYFPWNFEMTLVNKKLFYDEVSKEITTLNRSCIPGKPDIQYPDFMKTRYSAKKGTTANVVETV